MDYERIIDEIKSKLKISDFIKTKIDIKSAGGDRYIGLCPFHKEKTPSFKIDDRRGIYKCFGCGAGGDIFNFVKDYNKLSNFPEVVEILANFAGIPIQKSKEKTEKYEKSKKIFEINKIACDFFIENLNKNKNAISYIKNRNFDNDVILFFKIGYAPDSYSSLVNYLKLLKFADFEILNSGFIKKADSSNLYSIFRDRIIIPIFDNSNKVIAFGGRSLSDDISPKYINSIESEIFKKSEILYNLNNAKNLHNEQIVVVEGYMDVISLYKKGIKTAVAPLGTSVTENHLSIISKYSNSPVFWLDSDNAGLNASFRVAKMILNKINPKFQPRFVIQNKAKDPDEYANKFSIEDIKKEIEKSFHLHEFIWAYISKDVKMQNPNEATKLLIDIEDICSSIENHSIKREYLSYFKSMFYKSKFKNNHPKINQSIEKTSTLTKIEQIEISIVNILILKTELLDVFYEYNINFTYKKANDIFNILVNENNGSTNLEKFLNNPDCSNFIIKIDDGNLENKLHRLCVLHQIEGINREIKLASNSEEGSLSEKIKILTEERSSLLEKIEKFTI